MIRDQGPIYVTGFGTTSRSLPVNDKEEKGASSEAGFLSKRLNNHPFARFFLYNGLALAGMAVAGSVVREGGVKLAARWGRELISDGVIQHSWKTNSILSVRKLQKLFDDWDGIDRHLTGLGKAEVDGLPPTVSLQRGDLSQANIFDFRNEIKRDTKGIFYSQAAKAGAGTPGIPEWHWRDTMKRSMVRQARRLPYELPAMYATQRFMLDPMFGHNPEERRVKWYNPIDVLGDFAQQSAKNMAGLLVPLDAGTGLAKEGWQRFMSASTYIGSDATMIAKRQRAILLGDQLAEFGQDVSSILYKTANVSSRTTGAFGAAIGESVKRNKGLVAHLHESRTKARKEYNANLRPSPRRTFNDIFGAGAGDVKVGPLGGFGTFGTTFKKEWQNPTRASATHGIEFVAESLASMSPGIMPKDRTGSFVKDKINAAYKTMWHQQLIERGVSSKTADEVIRALEMSTPSSRKSPFDARAFRIGEKAIDAPSVSGWRDEFQRRINHLDPSGVSADVLTSRRTGTAVNKQFWQKRGELSKQYRQQWNDVYRQEILPEVHAYLRPVKLPSEALENVDPIAFEQIHRDMAVMAGFGKQWAQSGKTNITDVRARLRSAGYNLEDPVQLRAMFETQGKLQPKSGSGGFNVFGVKPLSVQRGLDLGYFDNVDKDTGEALRRLIKDLAPTALRNNQGSVMESLLHQLGVGRGVFETRSGDIVDWTPLIRGLRKTIDLAENELQIPLLQFSPLSLLRWKQLSQFRQSPFLQMITGAEGAPFIEGSLAGGRLGLDESLMLIKNTPAKGSLIKIGQRAVGGNFETDIQRLPGVYRSIIADHHVRQALGNAFIPDEGHEPTGWRKGFSVDPDQPQSLSRFFGRWRQRSFRGPGGGRNLRERASAFVDGVGQPLDIHNPRAFAQAVLSGRITEFSDAQRAAGMRNLLRDLRLHGFPPKVLSRLEEVAAGSTHIEMSPELRSVFQHRFPRDPTVYAVSQLRDKKGIKNFLQGVREADDPRRLIPDGDAAKRGMIYDLKRGIDRMLDRVNRDQSILEQTTAPALARLGLHRRIDEFKNEIYKYLIARQSVISRNQQGLIPELLEIGSKLHADDMLSGKELSEFRAAVLSIHLNLSRASTQGSGISTGASFLEMENVLRTGPGNIRGLLQGYANFDDRVGPLSPLKDGANFWQRRATGATNFVNRARRAGHRSISTAAYEAPGTYYSKMGGGRNSTFAPTFGTRLGQNPIGAMKSVTGWNTTSSPNDWSPSSMPVNILFQRLNRYFSTFNMGINESDFKGPLDFYARGMVGKRVLPIYAGAVTGLALDSTLGGVFGGKDDYGNRRYRPLVLGAAASGIARGQMAAAGIVPGGDTYAEKREELLHGEVPIRRGRWWPLGNTPWRGDRIQYYRPSWYRRFKSGYKYGDQGWGSPMEKLAFGYDFSPLRPLDPYRYERKHYRDRPYPVSGEYFTGPWGPLTGVLNSTVGRLLKPPKLMHKDELKQRLSEFEAQGYYGAKPPGISDESARVLMRTAKRQAVQVPIQARNILGIPGPTSNQVVGASPYALGTMPGQESSSVAPGGPRQQIAKRAKNARQRGLALRAQGATGVGVGGLTAVPGGVEALTGSDKTDISSQAAGNEPSRAGTISRNTLLRLNQAYAQAASRPSLGRRNAYQYPVMMSPSGMSQRMVARGRPVAPPGAKYQASMAGYQMQELAGIYGFGFGSLREGLGLGPQDLSPRKPVLSSASRAYGTERSFWDLNLGGLGDFPTPIEGEYGNLEVSEIVRRFIPHRRRDENEVNPLANTMGMKYPWLPGADYFTNFKQGDPFTHIPEGEMRLPGSGYERFNKLHSDSTGRYGLVDKFKILGDVAPWSNQYKAMEKVLQLTPLRPSEKAFVQNVKRQVRAKKKSTFFSPYQYANQDFQTKTVKIKGFVPGRADQFVTDEFTKPIRLSGVRASRKNRSGPARNYMSKLIQPGSEVQITYDANKGPLWGPTGTIDAYVKAGGVDVNQQLMNSGYGKKASIYSPLDRNQQEGAVRRQYEGMKERIFHRNTLLNAKFLPYRTSVEDWERRNVYGATFPQWQHPVRDFLKPMVYRAANRDVFTATLGLAGAGTLFGRTPAARAVTSLAGGVTGASTSLFTNARSYETGERFIPKARKKELALEEYVDILKYIKYSRLYSSARVAAISKEGADPEGYLKELPEGSRMFTPLGPITQQAIQYRKEMQRTMYGADPFGDLMDVYAAMPKRKRKYFMEFLKAPLKDRARILSTAPRLERRIYEARWGLKVEKRPDLVDYFSKRELPSPDWEGWNPNVDLETVKLKMANHMGLDASQMGYYPQQVKEANLINPSYPDINMTTKSSDVSRQLRILLRDSNIDGSVREIPTPYGGSRVEFNSMV